MKGIILAGGSGTRLYPLTKVTSKQLLSFVLLLAVEIVLCYFVAPIYNRFIRRFVN